MVRGPGGGRPDDGDPKGQANLYLSWQTEDVVDRPDRWEITLGLIPKAPKDACTVDVTPRRVQQFKPRAGQTVRWTNTALGGGPPIQQGEAKVDRLGLVTLEKVRVGKGKNRVRIQQ